MTDLDWKPAAEAMARRLAHPQSRWYPPLCVTPRHLLVPSWWEGSDGGGWTVRHGATDPDGWLEAAYANTSLVTQVDTLHADHAQPGTTVTGVPTSSTTMPGLMVQMYRHAHLYEDARVLDVGFGSGYGAALLAARLGVRNVTSLDVDPYLIKAGKRRLTEIGIRPQVGVCDTTKDVIGTYDRIVASVAVRPVPAPWLDALRPGGRLVTTLTDLRVILTATKNDDGTCTGRIEWDRAGFMAARHGPDYPRRDPISGECEQARDSTEGEECRGMYPVLNVEESWELWTLLGIDVPGIRACYHHDPSGPPHLFLTAPDGSWAYAQQEHPDQAPIVREAGPQRLWDRLEAHRDRWVSDGYLQVYGSAATITPDGAVHLRRGRWEATIT
jgi:protein-L-isoaspartate O-methyltransferase